MKNIVTLYSKHKSTNLSLTELIDVNETDKLLHSSIPSIGIHYNRENEKSSFSF